MEYVETFLWKFSSKICSINATESHSNTIAHQFKGMNPFISYSWNTLKGDFHQKYAVLMLPKIIQTQQCSSV